MSILIFAFVVILIVAMLLWGIDFTPFGQTPKQALSALVIIMGAVLIAQRAGLF